MKEIGFIFLLKDRGIKVDNIGFMKDKENNTGVSCKAIIKNKSYAIWFLQRNFPEGIYVIAVTKLNSCTIFPMYEYLETRNMQDVIKFIDKISINGVDESNYETITHPWTELSKRIMKI